MSSLCAIRTHHWGEDARRLHVQLEPVFGDRLVTVFQNRPESFEVPLAVVDLNADWLRDNGLAAPGDWGWRCGDYALYALRQARPDAEHYWLIEPDVHFTGAPETFFARFDAAPEDLLGLRPSRFGQPHHRFVKGVAPLQPWRAIFALTRVSGRALDRLIDERRAYSAEGRRRQHFANDEIFVYSTVAAAEDLSLGDLCTYAGDWFDGAQFDTDPDILIRSLEAHGLPDRVYHPVRSAESFVAALAKRITGGKDYLRKMRPSLDLLQPQEIETLLAGVRANLIAAIGSGKPKRN